MLPARDSVKIRRKTVERSIPCLTSIDTANALANILAAGITEHDLTFINIANLKAKQKLTH